ncbi:PREDICTED: sphingosine 1-phosphate receptor 4 [Nanorana parkeri]|uniref:sphingosine 1-phosphate receptor 4 n=1 Tax=Nanorana parkeri TaxID=125878 RepID=UPI0008540792|nr:PREDICTED: sphingosine 1-phosphate receptor 4 [Nanorana parkeri]
MARGNFNIILEHYNMTGRLSGRPKTGVVLTILFIFISFFIILENFVVLLALLRFLRLRRWVHCCLANIAFSDLLAGISYLINICLSGPTTFLLSPQLWFLREGLLFTTLAASTFSLLVTAVERYSTMVIPITERGSDKLLRVQALIILCWVLAVAVGCLPLLGWNCLCHIENCSSLLPLYSRNYIVFSLGLLGVTLLGIIGLYCTIYYFVCTSAKSVAVTSQSRRSFHLLQTVLIILGCFVICWTPLFLFLLVDSACSPPSCKSPLGLEWVLALAVMNSAFNPLIYSLRSSEVRKAILALLCCACTWAGVIPPACCQQVTEITSGSSNESSVKRRSSVRLSRNFSFRSPVTSVSSVPSQ